MNLNRFEHGDLVTWEAGEGEAKYLGFDVDTGMALLVLTKDAHGSHGSAFPKGLEVKMPHALIRSLVLN